MDDKLKSDASRGVKAKRLLNDELLVEAFSTIRQNLLLGYQASKSDQADEREQIYFTLKALKSVEDYLGSTLRNGEFAIKTLEEMNNE